MLSLLANHCRRPRASDLGFPEIGTLSAHVGYSRHAVRTYRANHIGLWNMGSHLRGDGTGMNGQLRRLDPMQAVGGVLAGEEHEVGVR